MQGTDEQLRQRAVRLGHARPRSGIVGDLRGEPFAHAAREAAPFREVLPEKEVEDEPDAGSQQQYDDPGNALQRVAVVGDDDQDDAEDRERVDDEEYVGQ